MSRFLSRIMFPIVDHKPAPPVTTTGRLPAPQRRGREGYRPEASREPPPRGGLAFSWIALRAGRVERRAKKNRAKPLRQGPASYLFSPVSRTLAGAGAEPSPETSTV